eukprot:jgi/Tetstr1/446691/TSEL_003630.t1
MVTVSVNYPLPLLKLQLAHVMEKVRAVQAKRLADLGRGAAELFNQEHCRVMWCKMAEKYRWTFHTRDFLRFFLDFHGNVNVHDGERAFENARQKATGDLHVIGLPMTLTLEIIEYAAYNELGARRLLRRNRRHMLPGASRDVLLEGGKHWGSTAAIASIG